MHQILTPGVVVLPNSCRDDRMDENVKKVPPALNKATAAVLFVYWMAYITCLFNSNTKSQNEHSLLLKCKSVDVMKHWR